MTFWLSAAVLTAVVVLLVLRPLLRKPEVELERSAYDREVYRDQLIELDRELARGAITQDQFEAARAEIGRRILSSADHAENTRPAWVSTNGRMLAAALVVAIPVGALGGYLALGRPGLPGQPFASREHQPDVPPGVAEAVARLAQRLEQQPGDPEGWRLLGESYKRMGRLKDAVAALRRAATLAPGHAELHASLGEALAWADQGAVTDEARQAFGAALRIDPKEPRARYYLALGRAQSGDVRGALDGWVALARDADPNAPWLSNVREQIAEAARQLNVSVPELRTGATARPGPDAQAMAAVQAMPPEERAAMIRGMVDGLAARLDENPDDLDGWLRLGRSYTVLGERERAADAYKRAALLAPGRADVLTALLGQLDPKSPDYAEVQRQLDRVKQGG